MNRYGQMLYDHYRQHHPDLLATLTDPTSYFSTLGEEAEATISRLRDDLLGKQQPDENLERYRQRSYQARRQAEELVLDELLNQPTPDPTSSVDSMLTSYRERLAEMSATLAAVDQAWTDTPADRL